MTENEMRMRGKWWMMVVIGLYAMDAGAQRVTYNHDATKMNQIMVMETGTGGLTPAAYYSLLHSSYAKSAAAKNKQAYRSSAGLAAYQQIDDAAAVDSAMTKRAEIEALNVADRTGGALDLAWSAEGGKITAKMEDYEKNIARIVQAGGTATEQEHWKEYRNVLQSAITAVREGYMPNSQRKKQYLQIYSDLCGKNEALVKYLAMLVNQKKTAELLTASYVKQDVRGSVATEAAGRWKQVVK